MSYFFAYLSRMKYIFRWGLMHNTVQENIQEHSHHVAVIAHALCVIKNKYFGGHVDVGYVVQLAVFHESAEVITGDLATPIKYFNPQIRDAYKDIENIAGEKLLNMLPEELRGEYEPLIFPKKDEAYRIMKAADKICAYIKCLEEIKASNHEFDRAKIAIERDIAAMDAPEVQYFMEHFAQGFSLTLDELN